MSKSKMPDNKKARVKNANLNTEITGEISEETEKRNKYNDKSKWYVKK